MRNRKFATRFMGHRCHKQTNDALNTGRLHSELDSHKRNLKAFRRAKIQRGEGGDKILARWGRILACWKFFSCLKIFV